MTTRETGRKLLEQTIKTLTPVTGWHCVTHESENRKTVRMTPVHFIAIVTERWEVRTEEDVSKEGGVPHTSILIDHQKRDAIYGVVYDLENYDDGSASRTRCTTSLRSQNPIPRRTVSGMMWRSSASSRKKQTSSVRSRDRRSERRDERGAGS